MTAPRKAFGRVFLDSFSTSLEDLPVKDKRDAKKVFDVIVANGRFSTFEIDDHLAKPVTYLFQSGFLKSDHEAAGYPWTVVEVTPRGVAWRRGEIEVCSACSGQGYTTERLTRRSAYAHPCLACNSTGFAPVATLPHPTEGERR
jgi:hypothetical protein